MEYSYNFIHSEWNDICIIDIFKLTITRKNILNESGKYYIKDNKIIINWDNWIGNDIFVKINNTYYHEPIYNNNSYIFIHNEWTDRCLILNNIIERESINDEQGTYNIINNDFIIKWNNWNIENIFIKLNNYYLDKSFYNENINNSIILDYELINSISSDQFILVIDTSKIFNINNLSIFGFFSIIDDTLTVKWNTDIEEIYIKDINSLNNIYYEKTFIEKNKNNNIKKYSIEKFKKINNEYFLKPYDSSIINDNLINKNNYKLIYNYIDETPNRLRILTKDTLLNNKDYLNINNINIHLNIYDNNDNFNYITDLELNFEIPEKKKRRCLSLVEWGYPPFGGGEDWLLNFNKIISNQYDNYLICFSDPFKNEYFKNIKMIDLNYIKIIQMEKDLISIIKIIKIINPDIINHQGVYRDFFMKISNILEIPFFTGFCFWQDIVKFNQPNINVNMLLNNNLEKTDEFINIINNSYTYVSSNFVNDIIDKLYNIKLDVIETISLDENFYIENNDFNIKKYVTLINCHYNKGGYLLKYLFDNLDINIPILLVNTENDTIINIDYLNDLITKRNNIKNINKLIHEKIDSRIIYKKTRILLIPSICEETFCRVGYEGMINNIPILSTKNGNLKYLLNNYAIFIDENNKLGWKNEIENIYNNFSLIESFQYKKNNSLTLKNIEKKICEKLNTIKSSKYKLIDKNIGLIVPWADQGLGIQGREYYISLNELGYNPFVLSFRPYHSTYDNIYLQSYKEEWNYKNVTYSQNNRDNLTFEEVFDFVYKNNIKQVIIIEASFNNIFKIIFFLKLINIKVYLVINIECLRLVELNYHNIFDKILTNNIETNTIITTLFKNKCKYLGFHLNHPYFQIFNKNIKINLNKIKFCCIGGLNSITRKNIDVIIRSFYNIFIDNIYLDWELNVYIQGVEVPNITKEYSSNNIKYHINNQSYKSIVETYYQNDIFIHMGSHEGLGIGFYESLYCGTPILTMNWTPNNEIIKDNINGWLIDSTFSDIYDNDNSLINKGIISEDVLKEKVIEILTNNKNTLKIINNTIKDKDNLYLKNKNSFYKNLTEVLST